MNPILPNMIPSPALALLFHNHHHAPVGAQQSMSIVLGNHLSLDQ